MILKNCEMWYAILKRPSSKFNKANPTWEVQLRTTDREQRDEWKAKGLKLKTVVPDEGQPYWYVNLKKRKYRADGTEAPPPVVVDAQLEEVDGNTIGNGSIGNVRIHQYDSSAEGVTGPVSILMGVQLLKHVVYERKGGSFEEFSQEGETEVVKAEPREKTSGAAAGRDEDDDEDEYTF